jgi:hypothetical protein
MALTPEEQQLINKLLQEGIALARQLGDETSKASLENFTGDLNTAERLVHSLRDEWKKYTSDVEGTREGFTNVVSEIKKLTTGSKAASTAFSGLTSLAAKLQRHQENTSKLSSKELKDLQKQVQEKVSDLKLAGKLSKQEVKDLETKKASQGLSSKEQRQLEAARAAHANISQEITENMGFIKQFNDQLDDSVNRTENLEDAIGLGGNALKGMQGAMGKLGLEGLSKGLNMEDATSAMDDMASKLTNNGEKTASLGDKFKILGSGAKSAFSGLGKSLLGPEALIAEFVDALQKSDKAAGDLAKSFNITYSEALDTRRELSNMATLSGDVALNTKGLQESMVAVGKSLGTNAKLNDDDLKTFTKLREQAGYTNEELIGIQKLSLVNGKTLEDNTAEILGGAEAYAARNGFVVNEKDILKEVSAASASLKLTLGGSAEAVAKAAVQAKQFGLNLEQAEKISESLLQFETSIESELSAELLTGKNLNFERARALALEGKTAEAAAEVAKQVGTSRDFAKMNVIQQEALAKAAGMTRDELAQSLMDREALTKLSDVEGKDAKEKFNNLVKQVGLEEAKKRLGNEQLANQFAQQSVQERFAQATEKLKEVFISIAEPVLAIISPIVDLVTTILPAVNLLLQPLITGFQFIADTIGFISGGISMFAGWMKEGSAAATALKIVLAPIAAIVGVIAAGLIYASLAAIPVVGPALGAIAVVGMLAMLVKAASGAMSSSKKGNDVMSPGDGSSGYGKRTLFGPEGAIQLNNKDTVIAGTDLFKKGDDVISAPKDTLNVSKGDDAMSTPKNTLSVSNKTSPKKEIKPVEPNMGEKFDRLIAAVNKRNEAAVLIQ